MKGDRGTLARQNSGSPTTPDALLAELRELIHRAREHVARAIDSGLAALYWQGGHRVRAEILKEKRAEYGSQIVSSVGRQLELEFGRGFSEKSLRHMIRFAEAFPDPEIVSALSRQLGWSHFVEIIYLDEPLKRDFYAEMCRVERWSVRGLRKKPKFTVISRGRKPHATWSRRHSTSLSPLGREENVRLC